MKKNLKIKIFTVMLCFIMLLPSMAYGNEANKEKRVFIRVEAGSREQENYNFKNPIDSEKYLLLLAEIYTPDKLEEWNKAINEHDSFRAEMRILRKNEKYREKQLIKSVIRDVLDKKIKNKEISSKEWEKEEEKIIEYIEVEYSLGEFEIDEYDVLETFDSENKEAMVADLNEMLDYHKALVAHHTRFLEINKNMLTNPNLSKDNKYFDEELYNKYVEKDNRKYKEIFDEELLGIVQLHTPEKFEGWKNVIEDHRKRSREVIKQEIDRRKEIEERLTAIKKKYKEGKVGIEEYHNELKALVKRTYIYNWYKTYMEDIRKLPEQWETAAVVDGNEIKFSVEVDPKIVEKYRDYVDMEIKLEDALEDNNLNSIKETLNELLKERQELQNHDYFIIRTII